MIGASRADMMISKSADSTSRIAPPEARRVSLWINASSRPKNFKRGHAGNSEKSLVKYSGRI